MSGVLEGVRAIEIAHYAFVPAAGAILADWGADVVKIEDTNEGDPVRNSFATRYGGATKGFAYMWEIANRGKRSIAVDLNTDDGQTILHQLVKEADVILTSMLPSARERLGLSVDALFAQNPRIIVARGSAVGEHGPQGGIGGFDLNSYWCRSGIASAMTTSDAPWPTHLPVPAFGDLQAGVALAGGIAAALYRRDRSGVGSVVDSSLLATGLWAMQGSILASQLTGQDLLPLFSHRQPVSPLGNIYRTADGRFIVLAIRQSQRYWAELCERLGRVDLTNDQRFIDARARDHNVVECTEILLEIFAERPLREWVDRFEGFEGAWDVVRYPGEVCHDPQVLENRYVANVEADDSSVFSLIQTPVQFDDASPPRLPRAPRHGADTDEVLQELGMSPQEIVELRRGGHIK